MTKFVHKLSQKEKPRISKNKKVFSVAVLLVEIMHADHVLRGREESTVTRILCDKFGLAEEDAVELFAKVNHLMKHAISLQKYTALLNSSMNYQEKIGLINALWCVAYSDNMLDLYEEHLIRRVSDLLYISHSDFIKQKFQVNDSI